MIKLTMFAFVFVYVAVIPGKCDKSEGFTVNESTGHSYKIMYKAENWTIAKDTCANNGAKLAVPKSKEEFLFIQGMVHGMHYPDIIGANYKYLVWLGINNLEDYKVWKNIDGENIEETGFHDWAGQYGQDPWPGQKEPHCVGMDSTNPGLREFWCHLAQPYVCEKKIQS